MNTLRNLNKGMCWLLLSFAFIVSSITPLFAVDPFTQGWTYRKQITIDNTKVDSDQTDFPVLISLDTDADLAAKAQSDGDDILFTDNLDNKIPHEIELFPCQLVVTEVI